MAPPKIKSGKAQSTTVQSVVLPPTHAVIYYADEYPSWQATVLKELQKLESDSKGTLPENAAIAGIMAKVAELKTVIKKVMPFVTVVREQYGLVGREALNTKGHLDERKLLVACNEYFCNALQLEEIQIVKSTEAEHMTMVVCPKEPAVEFSTRPHVTLTLHNVQSCTPHFTLHVGIMNDDSVDKVVRRLRRMHAHLTRNDVIQLYVHDSQLAYRQMPDGQNCNGKVMQKTDKFVIDTDANVIRIGNDKGPLVPGNQMIYTVNV